MYSLKRKFIILYNVDLFPNSRNPHSPDTITDKITLYLKARVYNVLARQINKSYDHRHQQIHWNVVSHCSWTVHKVVRLSSCPSYCTIPTCLRVQVIRISVQTVNNCSAVLRSEMSILCGWIRFGSMFVRRLAALHIQGLGGIRVLDWMKKQKQKQKRRRK